MTDVDGSNKPAVATGMLKWLWVSLLIVIADQVTKQMVSEVFVMYERLSVTPFFNLTLAHNYGAAFSFLADQGGWQRYFFTGIAVVISVVLLVWLHQTPKNDRWVAISLALILGGAIGNVYDRVMLGYVVDFLDFYYQSYHFPAFNVADSAISIGAVMMAIDLIRHPDKA